MEGLLETRKEKEDSRMERIGRHKYQALKSKEVLTEKEETQIKEFEDQSGITESNQSVGKYFEKVYKEQRVQVRQTPSIDQLTKAFKSKLPKYQLTGPIRSTIAYFTNCEIKMIECLDSLKGKPLNKARKKGLLLIGNYGTGKTSTMRTIEQILRDNHLKGQFKGYTANEIVELYEECQTPQDKKGFWKRMLIHIIYIDDVKTEREASNYGKANIIKEIIEKRYDRGLLTHISCNYKSGHANEIEPGIAEFGERYGGRVLDRIFEMFNIIEFKQKSFRK